MDRATRRLVGDWLAAHHGVIATATLRRLGCAPSSILRQVDRGELLTIFPGVFKSAHWPTGAEQLMVAVCARNPNVAVGFGTAAKLWRFRRMPVDDRVHVIVRHGSTPMLSNVVVHRCRNIDARDLVSRVDGIRLTSPTRTLFDCADVLGVDAATSVLDQLIDDGAGTLTTHVRTLVRLGHPLRPGTRTMSAVIRGRDPWRKAVQSDLEHCVLAEITRQRLPDPEVQFVVNLADGSIVRFDVAWPVERVGLEVDHPFWHAGAEATSRDKRRDRKLAAEGWTVCRITDVDVAQRLSESISDVHAILRRSA